MKSVFNAWFETIRDFLPTWSVTPSGWYKQERAWFLSG